MAESFRMGHYCRICGRKRANEKFSGKGHRVHVCKDCGKLPLAQREKIETEDEVAGFLRQSRVSQKNRARLAELSGHADAGIRHLAGLVLRAAGISEGKRKRWGKVLALAPSLYRECLDKDLVDYPVDFESRPDDSNGSVEIPF